ncbi:MAG: hypothetical protein KDK36_19385, partial [Leptospiraceae bacterium]|nr:hypothetical protein [Leptospiraceae bacterium]
MKIFIIPIFLIHLFSNCKKEDFPLAPIGLLGGSVCVNVLPKSDGTTTMYDEAQKKDIAIPANSTFSLVKVMREETTSGNKKSTVFISPLTKILRQRIQTLAKSNPGTNSSLLARRAGKEMVIRFGLSSAISSRNVTKGISDSNYPDFDDLNSQMSNPSSTAGKKIYSLLAGNSQMAKNYK